MPKNDSGIYKMKLLSFNFDNTRKDALVITERLNEIVLYEYVNINFCGVNTYALEQDCFDHVMHRVKYFLGETLGEKLKLHKSLRSSSGVSLLGYQWCKYLQKKERKDLIYDREKKGIQWVGYSYVLFESSGSYGPTTWLYNDEQGNIVFELTPVYPWFYSDPEPKKTFIKYSEWMKTYKPLLIRTISKETAQQWLKQIDELVEVVKKNDERLRCTGLGCANCAKAGKTGCPCGSLLTDAKKDCCFHRGEFRKKNTGTMEK